MLTPALVRSLNDLTIGDIEQLLGELNIARFNQRFDAEEGRDVGRTLPPEIDEFLASCEAVLRKTSRKELGESAALDTDLTFDGISDDAVLDISKGLMKWCRDMLKPEERRKQFKFAHALIELAKQTSDKRGIGEKFRQLDEKYLRLGSSDSRWASE